MTTAPAPVQPLPSPRQLAQHRREFYGFIHFSPNTFTGKEWGYGDESPAIFNPSACDPRQWARVARAAGMTGLILTCKHHDGFCLWPSQFTEHSIKNSPYRGGKGDLVREFTDACRAEGLAAGVYLSPWDRNHAEYGRPAYLTYYRNQLRELLTNYGTIFEVWFDGANGGDGYYGGARETRKIDAATYYDWPTTHQLVRELQPDAIMFSDAGPDIRWIGNEDGWGAETNWNLLRMAGRYPGCPQIQDLGTGNEDGDQWLPAEADTSIRPGWFYHEHEDAQVKTLAHLIDTWYASVGRGATLLLNLPPDRRGLIHEHDVERLQRFREVRDLIQARDAAHGARASATNVRGAAPAFAAANAIDGQADSYWATDDDVTAASLEIVFPAPTAINHVLAQEYIALGQRVQEWTLEARVGGVWQQVVAATTIGWKRVIRFDTVTADAVRLNIRRAKASPCIAAVRLFSAPVLLRDPVLRCDRTGQLIITATGDTVLRYTLDGRTPTGKSPVYTGPVPLPPGGATVTAASLAADNPGSCAIGAGLPVSRRFGYAKAAWRIVAASSEETERRDCRAGHAIDDNPDTYWETGRSGDTSLPPPHHLIIDLGAELTIGALAYQPRRDTWCVFSLVEQYAFHLSRDGVSWGEPVAAGRFDNILANPCEQFVPLATPVTARFLKFTVLASCKGHPGASTVGLHVFPAK